MVTVLAKIGFLDFLKFKAQKNCIMFHIYLRAICGRKEGKWISRLLLDFLVTFSLNFVFYLVSKQKLTMIICQVLLFAPYGKMTDILKQERSVSLNPSELKEFVAISRNLIMPENPTQNRVTFCCFIASVKHFCLSISWNLELEVYRILWQVFKAKPQKFIRSDVTSLGCD